MPCLLSDMIYIQSTRYILKFFGPHLSNCVELFEHFKLSTQHTYVQLVQITMSSRVVQDGILTYVNNILIAEFT